MLCGNNLDYSFLCLQIALYYFWASDKPSSTIAVSLAGSVCLPFSNTGEVLFLLSYVSLLAAAFFSKGRLDECLVIANTQGRYGGDQVGKKAGQGQYGRACRSHVSSHSLLG